MQVAVFSTKPYDRQFLDAANAAAGASHELRFLEARLSPETAELARGAQAVCAFVNDRADAPVLEAFAGLGVRPRILTHLNNTNPALLDDSPERAHLDAQGWEVAWDGMEIAP